MGAGVRRVPGQGIRQGRPLPGSDGHLAEPAGGTLCETGCWLAGFDPATGLDDPMYVIVCSEAAAGLAMVVRSAGAAAGAGAFDVA